ncbi:Maf-like protein [soil metagenome]
MSVIVPRVILASTSRYRHELLARILPTFEAVAPDVDETALPDETVTATALRLSIDKALAVASRHPDAIVIGGDQLAELDGEPIGKPGNFDNALAQLRRLRGRDVQFHSGICLLDGPNQRRRDAVVSTRVRFRELPDQDLADYLRIDEPWDCAGSARAEALGITIVEAIESDDPTALIGLPLITIAGWLRETGYPMYATR